MTMRWVSLGFAVSLLAGGCSDEGGEPPSGGAGGGGAASTTTTGTATTSTTATGTGGAMGPGPGEPCDIVGQDCADSDAPKCVVTGIATSMPAAICAEALGDVAEDEPCTRPTNEPGVDDCAPGLYCSPAGFPAGDPQERACQPLCNANDDCIGGEFCQWFTPTAPPDSPSIGVCVPTCDVLGTECQDARPGTGCQLAIDTSGTYQAFCNRVGAGVDGDACATVFDCAAGFVCDPSLVCRPFCGDVDHACAPGSTCTPYANSTPVVSWCVPS